MKRLLLFSALIAFTFSSFSNERPAHNEGRDDYPKTKSTNLKGERFHSVSKKDDEDLRRNIPAERLEDKISTGKGRIL